MIEESIEAFQAGKDKRELAKEIGDIFEVIDAIIEAYGLSREEIMEIKEDRKEKRGGFQKKFFLLWSSEN